MRKIQLIAGGLWRKTVKYKECVHVNCGVWNTCTIMDKDDLGVYSIFILVFTIWQSKCSENNIKSQYHILSTEQGVLPVPEAP